MLRDKELELITGGNPMVDSFRNHKKNYIIGMGVGVTAIVITIGMIVFWYYKKNHRFIWTDETQEEKWFIQDIITNRNPISIEDIKNKYNINEIRADELVKRHKK